MSSVSPTRAGRPDARGGVGRLCCWGYLSDHNVLDWDRMNEWTMSQSPRQNHHSNQSQESSLKSIADGARRHKIKRTEAQAAPALSTAPSFLAATASRRHVGSRANGHRRIKGWRRVGKVTASRMEEIEEEGGGCRPLKEAVPTGVGPPPGPRQLLVEERPPQCLVDGGAGSQ